MRSIRLISGRLLFACAVVVCAAIGEGRAQPADQFPFDQELMLNVPPMRPGKRMPVITIESNGNAVIGLWCKSVPAHVQFSDTAMKIEAAPLPDDLPAMQGKAQCTPERMAADGPLLETFGAVTAWHRDGNTIVLDGPTRLTLSAPAN